MTCDSYLSLLKSEYSVVKQLSVKNGGSVYVFSHKTLGKRLVVRVYLEPNEVYSFLSGVKVKNLPVVFDALTLEDGQVVLEEYIDGISVSQVLESGLYTYSGAKRIIVGICDALEPLHDRGIVHRDIKPENVMISNDGSVKLIDFNASRTVKADSSKDTVAIGTIGYASPEQFGLSQSDPRTDIYAVGILLNVMLTGEHPSRKLAKGRAGRIVLRCTQIDPNKRYPTVSELKASL